MYSNVFLTQCEREGLTRRLNILFCWFKLKEFVWKSQPDGEGSLDQTETEASHSPTGVLQSFVPTWEVLQETTARLLFMAVRWVRCLAPFQTLSKDDQLLLLQQTWTQLFLLHLAQWAITRDISGLLEDDQVRRRLPPEQSYRDEIVTIQVTSLCSPIAFNFNFYLLWIFFYRK